MNQETRNCQNCKKEFVIEPDDFAFIVALFSSESKTTVYCNKCWWSDKWVPCSFREQYLENIEPAVKHSLETGELTPTLQSLLPIKISSADLIKIRRSGESINS